MASACCLWRASRCLSLRRGRLGLGHSGFPPLAPTFQWCCPIRRCSSTHSSDPEEGGQIVYTAKHTCPLQHYKYLFYHRFHLDFTYITSFIYPGNQRFVRDHNLNLLSESLSNILTPQFPWPRTLTNHNSVSDIGGPKAVLPTVYGKSLIHWLAWLVWICHHLYSSDWL